MRRWAAFYDLPLSEKPRYYPVAQHRAARLTIAAERLGADPGLLAFARALCVWRSLHRHCGRCGTPNQAESGGHRLRCPACGNVSFPRTDPAVIFSIRHGQRCLLGRQPGWPPGRYSTLAGFVEPGETLEAAVVREAHEEAGIVVDQDEGCETGQVDALVEDQRRLDAAVGQEQLVCQLWQPLSIFHLCLLLDACHVLTGYGISLIRLRRQSSLKA